MAKENPSSVRWEAGKEAFIGKLHIGWRISGPLARGHDRLLAIVNLLGGQEELALGTIRFVVDALWVDVTSCQCETDQAVRLHLVLHQLDLKRKITGRIHVPRSTSVDLPHA